MLPGLEALQFFLLSSKQHPWQGQVKVSLLCINLTGLESIPEELIQKKTR
jgi:hypothetical protein